MKQIVSNYSYSPTTNVVTLTGVNIDQDQLLLVVAPQVGRTMYNFASGVTGVVSSGVNTRVTLNASTAGLTTTSPLVIFYDDHASTQTIAGTVTANVSGDVVYTEDPNGLISLKAAVYAQDSFLELQPVGANNPLPISGTVTVGNSVTIGSLPAISGTVTAQFPANSKRSLYVNSPGYAYFTGIYVAENQKLEVNRVSYKSTNSDASIDYRTDDNKWYLTTGGGTGVYKSTTTGSFEPIGLSWQQGEGANFPPYPTVTTFSEICVADAKISSLPAIRGTVTANTGLSQPLTDTQLRASAVPVSLASLPASTVTARLQDGSGNNLTSTSIGGVQRLNVSLASAATPGGTLPTFVNVYGGSDGSAVRTISVDSTGRQNTNVQLPRVTLIDGSGTVTTANTAITVFASSSTRSYLLVQVTTGSAFVNVGATATTVNGINLTAGQGYSWETTIPQGIVSLISTTTSSRYVAKEA